MSMQTESYEKQLENTVSKLESKITELVAENHALEKENIKLKKLKNKADDIVARQLSDIENGNSKSEDTSYTKLITAGVATGIIGAGAFTSLMATLATGSLFFGILTISLSCFTIALVRHFR